MSIFGLEYFQFKIYMHSGHNRKNVGRSFVNKHVMLNDSDAVFCRLTNRVFFYELVNDMK